MSFDAEVAALTRATTNLLSSVNVTQASLEAQETTAQNEAASAATNASDALAAKNTATTYKDNTVTYSNTATGTVTYQDIAAIAAEKAVTATDVFVYDTSKDSDGGAWRNRCQHTSWYNETLNTATRGSRKEFPAVAVIVAEGDKITVYDGDDPTLPMWMVFYVGRGSDVSSRILPFDTAQIQTVYLLNGLMAVGADNTGGNWENGLITVNFITEESVRYTGANHTGTGESIRTRYGIAARNDSVTWLFEISSNSIIHGGINDVAITALPDAPIHEATGLPIPTIAVATYDGASVIKDDGTIVDIISSYEPSRLTEKVIFTDENGIGVFHTDKFNLRYTGWQWYSSVPSSDTTYTQGSSKTYGCSGIPSMSSDLSSVGPTSNFKADYGLNQFVLAPRNGFVSKGISIADHNPSNTDAALVSYITSTYNTGWMPGDIQGAFLSDTDDTDLVASGELVTNGTFDTDTNGWVTSNVTAEIIDGEVKLTSTVQFGALNQTFSTEVGKTYRFQITSRRGSAFQARARIYNSTASVIHATLDNTTTSNITQEATFVATTETSSIRLEVGDSNAGRTVYYDNISVRLADNDRSVKNNGLVINSAVTRTPVATGAELVEYTAASELIASPGALNGSIDATCGTDPIVFMFWGKVQSQYSRFFTLKNEAEDVVTFRSGPNKELQYRSSTSLNNVTYPFSPAANLETDLQHITIVITSDNVISAYINGVSVGSTVQTILNGVTFTTLSLFPPSFENRDVTMSLFRHSATVPTPEQIAKIYEDEKALFQENAACTLYGTSDAVTALAYDDSTNLLHVGTSEGRSVFDGLQRVDNTTTAVGTAISAVNGMVVEE